MEISIPAFNTSSLNSASFSFNSDWLLARRTRSSAYARCHRNYLSYINESRHILPKIRLNRFGPSTQPCLTTLSRRKLYFYSHTPSAPECIFQIRLLIVLLTPSSISVFIRAPLSTESKAFTRSINTMYESFFSSPAVSTGFLNSQIAWRVLQPFLKPNWYWSSFIAVISSTLYFKHEKWSVFSGIHLVTFLVQTDHFGIFVFICLQRLNLPSKFKERGRCPSFTVTLQGQLILL